jgi:hypothetical protein
MIDIILNKKLNNLPKFLGVHYHKVRISYNFFLFHTFEIYHFISIKKIKNNYTITLAII